ncbi:YdjC-like protein [Nitrobacter winogradskyi Nb-255]|uniref:YdjC-like protein n=1 Tax=Nitrobacter winogradskyi (strain ATCC 25391 / DSM 10237 / CIP 104748 / NCIMB 11846 / Nb-255) TaxID=323098 RepID=Q3SPH0_NITWN|nr:ChbG/HpnK family deacetylase [Nitrobacter winogradskyi]ABA05821.1 YdjC-like protein [Nitrobacter winogradskyi Nb-255]
MSGDDIILDRADPKPLQRRIRLCADDYGISPGVNRAIRDLIERERINATSVMVVGPAAGRDEVEALKTAASRHPHCAIGLHLTLTAPFHPLTLHYRPLDGGLFPPLSKMLRASLSRRLEPDMIFDEVTAQIAAFGERFGRAPEYVDGHQHVQIFPQVRDAFLNAVKTAAPGAWVRQCGRSRHSMTTLFTTPKALLLDILSAGFRREAARTGIGFNPAFAGAYDFNKPDFAAQMQQFLNGSPDDGLIMCHPGFVDDTLVAFDPLTDQREREYEFLAGDHFADMLAANRVTLG